MKCMEYDPQQNSTLKEDITLPPKDDQWFSTIKWTSMCITCKAESGGNCPNRDCAEYNYDPWGDPFPLYLWHPDGNDVYEYLQKKAALLD